MVDPVQEYCTEEAYYIELNGKLEKEIQSLTKKLERCKEVIGFYGKLENMTQRSSGLTTHTYYKKDITTIEECGYTLKLKGKRARLALKEIWGGE